MRLGRAALGACVFLLTLNSGDSAWCHESPVFDTDIQPILNRSCGGGGCHIEGTVNNVNLSTYENVLESIGSQYGTAVVIPRDPEASPLVDKIRSEAPRFGARMPRRGDLLTAKEIDLIVNWIRDGALRTHTNLRGDFNRDDVLNLTDAVASLNYLFRLGDPPECESIADANSDDALDLSDAVFVLRFLFLGGPSPAALTEKESDACDSATELSFASIQEKVFATTCAFSSCHSSETRRAGLSLATADEAYEGLVGIDPFNVVALEAGMQRVTAGDPDASFLLRKLIDPGPGEGNRMPANSDSPLSDATIAAIREWIRAGAPREGTIAGVPDIDEKSPPPVERIPRPPVPENGYQLHLEPFSIGSRREREVFSFVDRPFAALGREEIFVKRIDIHMSEASHHFIVYQWIGGASPAPGLRPVSAVVDLLNSRRFVIGSQQSFFTIAFPEGVGIKFDSDVSFDLNSHFVNLSGEQPLQGEVYINFYFAEPGELETFVQPIFEINPFINVPPNQTRTTDWVFPGITSFQADPRLGNIGNMGSVPREVHVYSLSSHMHRHGVRFSAFLTENGDKVVPEQMVYDSFGWDDPVYTVFDPVLVLQPGQGFSFAATHTYHDPPSPNSPPLTFDVTSEDEMAILLGYYSIP